MNGSKNIYLFMGAPGSGKGSLAHQCVQGLGWKQLSTGNLCRMHVNGQTKIGKQIDFAIKSGKLISDELITTIVVEWLKQVSRDSTAVILDGYPRTLVQAKSLDDVLKNQLKDWKLQIIKLTVADDIIVDRLSRRVVCQNQECQAVYSLNENSDPAEQLMSCNICENILVRRNDDEPKAIRERLIIYHKHEDSLLEFYRKRGQVIRELNVEKPLPDVFRDFKHLIGFCNS